MTMLKDVTEVKAVGGYRLRLRFEDGVSGEVDVSEMVEFRGVFVPQVKLKLQTPGYEGQLEHVKVGSTGVLLQATQKKRSNEEGR